MNLEKVKELIKDKMSRIEQNIQYAYDSNDRRIYSARYSELDYCLSLICNIKENNIY